MAKNTSIVTVSVLEYFLLFLFKISEYFSNVQEKIKLQVVWNIWTTPHRYYVTRICRIMQQVFCFHMLQSISFPKALRAADH
jgi:hypothetical protein